MEAKTYRNNLNECGIGLNNLMRFKRSHVKAAGEMLAQAFHDDPLFAYFVPTSGMVKPMQHPPILNSTS